MSGNLRIKTLIGALVIFLLLYDASSAQGQECMDCHSVGNDKNAPEIRAMAGSAHEGKTCADCHRGVIPPCPPESPALSCDACHKKQTKLLSRSDHAKDLQKSLKESGAKISLDNVCLSCHGKDVHYFPPNRDPQSQVFRTNIAGTCLSCHDEIPDARPIEYGLSIHAVEVSTGSTTAATCINCHGNHEIEHKDNSDSSVYLLKAPETCGRCHEKARNDFLSSVHWTSLQDGETGAAVCHSCHGEHAIRSRKDPLAKTNIANVTMTCAACHDSKPLIARHDLPANTLVTYKESFHGLSRSLNDLRAANCASCHGHHAVLPSDNPDSLIHPSKLGNTCGACHEGAENKLIDQKVHVSRKDSHSIVGLVRILYLLLIFTTLGVMLAHNGIHFFTRLRKKQEHEHENTLMPRFTVNEKIQHHLLTVSFIVLAYTGFALSFPESFLAELFKLIHNGALIRNIIHRIAAAVFIGLALYHVGYLVFTRRGRAQGGLFRLRFSDIGDVRKVLRKPDEKSSRLPHYSYIEKSEYWALIWGAIIMIASGLFLLLTGHILGLLPLWSSDLAATIHFFEAVLACVALMVWHGYWVVRG